MAAERNLSAIAFQVLTAMSYGRRVELALETGASVKGVPTRIVEDLARKSDATRAVNVSHLLVELDGQGSPVGLERIREVKPTL